MLKPVVHINGTSKKELFEQFYHAVQALDVAIKALSDAAPNGRDFYPMGADAVIIATREHEQRMLELHRIRDYYEDVYHSLL